VTPTLSLGSSPPGPAPGRLPRQAGAKPSKAGGVRLQGGIRVQG